MAFQIYPTSHSDLSVSSPARSRQRRLAELVSCGDVKDNREIVNAEPDYTWVVLNSVWCVSEWISAAVQDYFLFPFLSFCRMGAC